MSKEITRDNSSQLNKLEEKGIIRNANNDIAELLKANGMPHDKKAVEDFTMDDLFALIEKEPEGKKKKEVSG